MIKTVFSCNRITDIGMKSLGESLQRLNSLKKFSLNLSQYFIDLKMNLELMRLETREFRT